MKIKILITSLLITLFFIGNINAQKSNLPGKLPWVNGNLPANSINYNYKVVQGDGESLSDSQNQAVENLIFQLGSEQGCSVSSETMIKTQSLLKNNKEEYSMNLQDKTVINQDNFKAEFSKIDEYFEETKDLKGNVIYRVWQLYVTGSSANNDVPKINYSNKYSMNDAGFKSLIVPGWGQFYKKKSGKGLLFLLGTTGSLGGFLYANNEHTNNMNRSKETNDIALKKQFVEHCFLRF